MGGYGPGGADNDANYISLFSMVEDNFNKKNTSPSNRSTNKNGERWRRASKQLGNGIDHGSRFVYY